MNKEEFNIIHEFNNMLDLYNLLLNAHADLPVYLVYGKDDLLNVDVESCGVDVLICNEGVFCFDDIHRSDYLKTSTVGEIKNILSQKSPELLKTSILEHEIDDFVFSQIEELCIFADKLIFIV